MEDEIKPSKNRVKNNIDSVRSLIEKEEKSMTKRKLRFKPLIIAAIAVAVSALSLVTVNAATKGAVVKFFMGGEEIEGEYYDYVDEEGFRRVSFGAVMPLYENNYALFYDVDAPQGENVRVLTPKSDPEFFENLGLYREAQDKAIEDNKAMWAKIEAWKGDFDKSYGYVWDAVKQEAIESGIIDPSEMPEFPKPEDYGFVFKDSELCLWRYGFIDKDDPSHFRLHDGQFGGKFLQTGAAYGKPSGIGAKDPNECHYDYENETQTIKITFYYYVGKE